MTQAQLIKRVEELEREMRGIKLKLQDASGAVPKRSAEDFFGIFHGDKHFKRAMEFGAAYRQSLRPRAKKGTRKQ